MKTQSSKAKRVIPKRVAKQVDALHDRFRRATASLRLTPDFIIIGAQKGGSSSLFSYLARHPNIGMSSVKEVHFFDANFGRGMNWYRSHFPSAPYRAYAQRVRGRVMMTGEASPSYLAHPHVPERLYQALPHTRLIVLLRNPVDRAYSHYHYRRKSNRESLSFEEAIRLNKEILEQFDINENNGHDVPIDKVYYSYLYRGMYLTQLKRWMSVFPPEQFLILRSEDLFADPVATVDRALEFLDLPHFDLKTYEHYNKGHYSNIAAATRNDLIKYFAPHNRQLYEYLNVDFAWND